MAIKRQLTENGVDIYPVTHQDLVVDNKGVSIREKLDTTIQKVNDMEAMQGDIVVTSQDIDDIIGMIGGL